MGRTGRGQKPPPQFGQTLCSTFSTQRRQKVHSKVQIIASTEFGGSVVLQFSQTGLSSSIERFLIGLEGRLTIQSNPAQTACVPITPKPWFDTSYRQAPMISPEEREWSG